MMQNGEPDSPKREKHPAKGCLLLITTVVLVFFALVVAGIASIIVVDTVNLRGEDHTLAWRVKRYKVACQFLWFDFKDAVSKKLSKSSPDEQEEMQSPVEMPGPEPEPQE